VISVVLPGDKSISHRALMLAAVADGASRLTNLGGGADVRTTAAVLEALGAGMEFDESPEGITANVRPAVLSSAKETLHCQNSGTTARLLAGIMVGLGIGGVLDGDASLRRRPMRRVVYPLQAMGAQVEYLGRADRLPMKISPRASGRLRALRQRSRIPSAQVKSAILLAGVLDGVPVEIREPARSRDHTERLLAAAGVPVHVSADGAGARIAFDPPPDGAVVRSLHLEIPGDSSSAAFMLGAALLLRRPIRIDGVSDNPTRTAFLEVFSEMGATIERKSEEVRAGEPVASWVMVPPDRLAPFTVKSDRVAALIDELPLLAILAARADGESTIRGAEELRVKESDRIALLASNLERVGGGVEEHPDGLTVRGGQGPFIGHASAAGDHRTAMAFGVLGVSPGSRISLEDPQCAGVSYPSFWKDLERLTQ